MRISHQWLKQYVDMKLSPEKLAEGLSMLGLEVASFDDQARKFEKFVVGEVLERAKHPNADRLTVCKVNVGENIHEIVCGAPNVAAGQKVAIALVGATIPHNQHDPDAKPFVLERARIRGVESNGMICSAHELGLGSDADGILVLDGNAKVGMSLAKHLGQTDIVYELEVTANRGDWLSHLGVAREVGALVEKRMRYPAVKLKESKSKASSVATVKIVDAKQCPRYSARVLRGVKVEPSPRWLQDRLRAVGLRPINNVVDVSNYVMIETGQPLHAFDYDRLSGRQIVVKRAEEGQKFTTLDGKTRSLKGDTLMICDGEKPVAIAGVMGGANSEISDSTTSILLESAYFAPASVRRTSKHLSVSTDASQRFERSTDIGMTSYAADRFAQLLQEMSGAEILRGVIDVYPKKTRQPVLTLRVARVNAVLGTDLRRSQVKRYLERLDLSCRTGSAGKILVTVPSFRNDIVEEIDLIEEVARVHGYNNIETKTRASIQFSTEMATSTFEDDLRDYCIGAGFNEILANSLQDSRTTEIVGERAVKILNPVSVDMAFLRTSLIPGALEIARRNQSHGLRQLKLFEYGTVFSLKDRASSNLLESYVEEERLLLLLGGEHSEASFGVIPRAYDFLDLKGEVKALCSKFLLDKCSFIPYDTHKALSEQNVAVEINGVYAGFLGTISRTIAQKFEIEGSLFVCELNVSSLRAAVTHERKFKSLPRFPAVTRDLAFVVDLQLPQQKIEDAIRESGGELLERVALFDLFAGEQIGEGKKSLAYSVGFQPEERTLTVKEIDEMISRIVAHVQRTCGATLRAL